MVFSESMIFNQSTSDNLNPADNTVPLMKKSSETLRFREKTTKITSQNIGHAFILGHATNGVLGVANGIDGSQITLGTGGYGALTLLSVTNPSNRFIETFRFSTFIDTGSSTGALNGTVKTGTATVDTSTWGEIVTLA